MSVKSKSSPQQGKCCIRTATLSIESFTQAINGNRLEDPYGPVDPSGLDGPINTVPLTITSDASDQCKQKIRQQIVQHMRSVMNQAFQAWLQTSPQAGLVTGLFPEYSMIRFIGGVSEWEFEIECCDETQKGSIVTSFDTFPSFYGIRLVADNQNDPTLSWLTPPIICRS